MNYSNRRNVSNSSIYSSICLSVCLSDCLSDCLSMSAKLVCMIGLDGGVFTFILPLIIDSLFHRFLPKIFSPNIITLIQNENLKYTTIRRMKRFDRIKQSFIVLFVTIILQKLLFITFFSIKTFIKLLLLKWKPI